MHVHTHIYTYAPTGYLQIKWVKGRNTTYHPDTYVNATTFITAGDRYVDEEALAKGIRDAILYYDEHSQYDER